jgi:DNA-binding transcriptional ArsR family regulator
MSSKVAMNTNRVAEAAGLMGVPARAAMLVELMGGRALTAGELARVARVTAPTASAHLRRMVDAGLLRVERQGRHRYHRLATPEVARMIESFMQFASSPDWKGYGSLAVGPKDEALRAARTCYDHIAGRLGVAIADRFTARGAIEFDDGVGILTREGSALMTRMGVDAVLSRDPLPRSTRPLCRSCLDWSERRPHLAGKLGAAILTHWLEQGWVRRRAESRTLRVTPKGRIAMLDRLGLRWEHRTA